MLKQFLGHHASNARTPAAAIVAFVVLCLCCLSQTVKAQIAQPDPNVPRVVESGRIVTASATRDRIRISAPNAAVQVRLEVYDELGRKVFDTEQRGGSVLDWHLKSSEGERVPDGTYLCVATVKNLSGRFSQKLGKVSISADQVSMQAVGATELNAVQTQAIGPLEENASLVILQPGESPAATVIAHDGNDGQLTRTRGALSFRFGDFFSGIDQEQMRLTEAGNLGIGTSEPKAKLDVAGTIRAQRFLVVKPGPTGKAAGASEQTTDAADSVQPLIAGTGTQNQIAKWTDNAGTLGDSGITETAGGFVGIGTTSPGFQLHEKVPAGGVAFFMETAVDRDVFESMGANPIAGPAFNFGYSGATFGRGSGFFNARPDAGAVAPNPSLRFMTANTQRMIITNTGNVGIGTTAPGYKLHVVGQDVRVEGTPGIFPRFSLNFTSGGANQKKWQNYADAVSLNFTALNDTEDAETGWLRVFRDNQSNSISNVLFPNGNVGIGTDANEKLTVAGTVQSTSGGFKFPDGSVQSTAAGNTTYTMLRASAIELPQAPPVSIAHLNLPPGTYLLTATIEFVNLVIGLDKNRDVGCSFSGDQEYFSSVAGIGWQTVNYHAVLTITSGGVDLSCHTQQPFPSSIYANTGRLTAVKIAGTVNVQ